MLLPIRNRGFIDTDNLSHLILKQSKFKPPLLDIILPLFVDLMDFRKFRAGRSANLGRRGNKVFPFVVVDKRLVIDKRFRNIFETCEREDHYKGDGGAIIFHCSHGSG
jgi:hypothetical protein